MKQKNKYGLKINNYVAGSIYEYDLGVRDKYDTTPAMATNSLCLDFLYENGLNVWKESSTRDIICIDFSYGSADYKEQIKKIEKKIKKSKSSEEKKRLYEFIERIKSNKDKYVKKTKQELREEYYCNGVTIEYPVWGKGGKVESVDKIHYKKFCRTSGKAKNGSVLFINECLHDKALDFIRMGIKLPYYNAPIVEIEAYSSLVISTIVGKIKIEPENILILKDVDVFMKSDIISVEINEEKKCIAKQIKDYDLKNTIFDGQALIDSSIFPSWGDGYILLRHHFCKMAAFSSNIQLFFKDHFGDSYETAKVIDMFGNEHYAKDIKLITTDNAVKWLKFDVSYDYWCQKVRENGSMFGIVKTAHESKLGKFQKMSYQMVNSLEEKTMESSSKISVDYINDLKSNDAVFIDYLKKNVNFSNDFEVLVYLYENNHEFIDSAYFRERRQRIIEAYIKSFRNGKMIQNGDNLVIVGSPYAMLLHSVGEDVFKDDTFCVESGCIQCHTKRFDDGEYLSEFRSPFNGYYNMGYLKNVYHYKFDRYFNFGKQIIAINMIGTDFQDRNNGLM